MPTTRPKTRPKTARTQPVATLDYILVRLARDSDPAIRAWARRLIAGDDSRKAVSR
jgi:hypothetical protein